MDYTPRHAQPVTLAQLRQLEPELLTGEIARLENSMQHLEASNAELRLWGGLSPVDDDDRTSAAAEDFDEDSKRDFAEAVKENEETIASQRERLTMIRLALEEKIGVDATNPHYERTTNPRLSNEMAEAAAAAAAAAAASANGLDAEMMAPRARSDATDATDAQAAATGEQPTPNGVASAVPQDDGMYL
ncbi:hypothetical protein JCM3774_006242 [Rhodotorula dairenensis]